MKRHIVAETENNMEDSFRLNISFINKENNISQAEEIFFNEQTPSSEQLYSKINETFGLSLDEYKLYFGLKCLECEPNQELSTMGLRSGNRLLAVGKKLPQPEKAVPKLDSAKVKNASYGLASMVQHEGRIHRSQKSALMKLLENKKDMNKIICDIPGLREDRAALDILENPRLFKVVVNPKYLKTVIDKHPCLAVAFSSIWDMLLTSSKYTNSSPSTSYPASMEVEPPPPSGSMASTSNQAANMITLSQLSAAIAQATPPSSGYGFPYSASSSNPSSTTQSPMTNRSSTTSTPQSRNGSEPRLQQITPEALNQAMQETLMSSGLREVSESLRSEGATASDSSSSLSEEAMQAGLEQLHAMGITDDEASRQALTATQGNVEAAINILFMGN